MKFPPQMDLSGVKHPEKIQAIQWCECRGKTHRLALINNRIVPLDHNITRELAMLDLGGEPCRCMRVYLGIRKRETKFVVQSFAPYMEEMIRKHETRERKFPAIEVHLHEKDRPPKDVQRLIELLIRYRCNYDLPDGTVISVTSTGARPFVRGIWYYKTGIGSNKYLLLQVNVPRDWKKTVYDRRIGVVDDHLVLSVQGTNPSRDFTYFGDVVIIILASGKGELLPENYRFGSKNATVMQANGKWRLKYMDPRVYYHDHQR